MQSPPIGENTLEGTYGHEWETAPGEIVLATLSSPQPTESPSAAVRTALTLPQARQPGGRKQIADAHGSTTLGAYVRTGNASPEVCQ